MNNPMALLKVLLCCMLMGALSGCEIILAPIIAEGIGTGVVHLAEKGIHDPRETDTRGAWGIKRTSETGEAILPVHLIIPSNTARGEVVHKLWLPEERTGDDRFFLYRYELQSYKVKPRDENQPYEDAGEKKINRAPVGLLRHARFLIWFDQADIVKGYRWHDCEPTADPKCHSANQMCEMINGLQDEKLIAHYCGSGSPSIIRSAGAGGRNPQRVWLPPLGSAKPIADFQSVAGKWRGSGRTVQGKIFLLRLIIKKDGSYRATSLSSGSDNKGTMRLHDGMIRFTSPTNGQTVTVTLNEGWVGQPLLKGRRPDGMTWEVKLAKR